MQHNNINHEYYTFILYGLNDSNFADLCVTITTGGRSDNDGYLGYTINGVEQPIIKFSKNFEVFSDCFESDKGLTISVKNDYSRNAWAGTIEITEGSRPTLIYCKECQESKFIHNKKNGNNLVVENDQNSANMGKGHCSNGKECTITWVRFGTVDISIVYFMKR